MLAFSKFSLHFQFQFLIFFSFNSFAFLLRLVYYYYYSQKTNPDNYNGLSKKFSIRLDNLIWKKISTKTYIQDNLTKEEFIGCLRTVNYIDILGDWTRGIETIGLDSVMIIKN